MLRRAGLPAVSPAGEDSNPFESHILQRPGPGLSRTAMTIGGHGVPYPDAHIPSVPGIVPARHPQVPPLHADGDCGPPTSTGRPPTDDQAASGPADRPNSLGVALTALVAVARGVGPRPARDGHRMATTQVPRTLTDRSGHSGNRSLAGKCAVRIFPRRGHGGKDTRRA
jgi:hypothetical protein